jgi:DNA-binding LacI/PurR family transcriptional regulator
MKPRTVRTIADIAKLAGVSKSTVSRALSDSPLIGERTREQVRAIARRNNFQLNAPARQLSLKQSRTVAYVTHAHHKEFSVADLLDLEIMGGVTRGLASLGYDLLVIHMDPHDTKWAHKYLDAGRVDGFILMTCSRKQAHIKALVDMGAPFIIWGVPQASFKYCSVSGDNLNGGKLATKHLVSHGRRRIGFIGGPPGEMEVQQRLTGYKVALEDAGRRVESDLIAYGDYSDSSGARALTKLLEHAPDLDGVFVNSDLMALAAMNRIRELGKRVPEDISVVGYDDLSIASSCNPPLTTIHQNIPLAGRLLAQNLVQYLQTGVVTNVSMPVELVVRESA